MKDIDVFLLLTLYRNQLNLPEEGIRQLLTEAFGFPVTRQDMERFVQQPPTTKQLVQALHDKGFTQKFIQEHLSLAQSTVSYHLATVAQNQYLNRFWAEKCRMHKSNV